MKIDDRFPRHRRVQSLGRDVPAKWLHVVALCYCAEHLTDGLIDPIALRQVIADADMPATTAKRCIPKLVDAGLWIHHEARDGYIIRDYLDYNPPADEVKARREAKAAAGRLGGLRSGETRRQNALPSDERHKRVKAAQRANVAERAGRIRRQNCQACGSDEDLQKHHEDYDRPEDVVWLCRRCHQDVHNTLRNEARDEADAS